MKQNESVKNLGNHLGYYDTPGNSVIILGPTNEVEIHMHHLQGKRNRQ